MLYADSGYAVVKPVAGSVAVGDTLQFVFETAADDSRKPRLMPVVAGGADNAWASAVSDMFARDIGFNASFQLSPVDVHFTQTKRLITGAANCVDWQKHPSMTQASGERKDPPDFFLRFTPALTPLATLSGAGGTKTSEMFHTLVTAQVVDQFGKVIYSETGDNDYTIAKVNGAGLGFAQAKEVSLEECDRQAGAELHREGALRAKGFQGRQGGPATHLGRGTGRHAGYGEGGLHGAASARCGGARQAGTARTRDRHRQRRPAGRG